MAEPSRKAIVYSTNLIPVDTGLHDSDAARCKSAPSLGADIDHTAPHSVEADNVDKSANRIAEQTAPAVGADNGRFGSWAGLGRAYHVISAGFIRFALTDEAQPIGRSRV